MRALPHGTRVKISKKPRPQPWPEGSVHGACRTPRRALERWLLQALTVCLPPLAADAPFASAAHKLYVSGLVHEAQHILHVDPGLVANYMEGQIVVDSDGVFLSCSSRRRCPTPRCSMTRP